MAAPVLCRVCTAFDVALAKSRVKNFSRGDDERFPSVLQRAQAVATFDPDGIVRCIPRRHDRVGR